MRQSVATNCYLRMSICISLKFINVSFFCKMWFVSINIFHFSWDLLLLPRLACTTRQASLLADPVLKLLFTSNLFFKYNVLNLRFNIIAIHVYNAIFSVIPIYCIIVYLLNFRLACTTIITGIFLYSKCILFYIPQARLYHKAGNIAGHHISKTKNHTKKKLKSLTNPFKTLYIFWENFFF